MTKTELIDKVSSSAGITKAEAGKTIDTTLKSIEVSLKKGRRSSLSGSEHSLFPRGRQGMDAIQEQVKKSKSLRSGSRNSQRARF
jgi:hypothetical protein